MFNKLKHLNKVIILLTLSDVIVWGTYLVAYPLQGIYLTSEFGEKSIQYISIGLFIYYMMRAVLPIPIGYFVDHTQKDFDEIFSLGLGNAMIGLSFIIFPFTTTPVEYYFLMGMGGIGAAFNLIGWRKLFAHHLDKNKEGREYAGYETIMSLCTAAFSLIGGELSAINHEIFRTFFFVVGVTTLIGGVGIALIILKQEKQQL